MKHCFLSLILILGGCADGRLEDPTAAGSKPSTSNNAILNYYCLLKHNPSDAVDSTTLYFFKEARWDTSFVLVLHRDSSVVRAIYQETSPRNMSKANVTGIRPFDGFVFETDVATWQKITRQTKKVLDTLHHENDFGYLDGPSYMLSYNFKYTVNRNKNDILEFEEFVRHLRGTLIYPAKHKSQVSE